MQITNKDIEIADYLFANYITKDVTGKRENDCKSYYLSEFRKKLRYYNLTNNKHIPLDYLKSTRKAKLELLAGLLDSDGHMPQVKHKNLNKTNKPLSKVLCSIN